MQYVDALLALGGDRRNTVPKTNISVAEVAVLQAIHGDDAVHDIRPVGRREVNAAAEVRRLAEAYPAKDETGAQIVLRVYPGRTPDIHRTLDELGVSPDLMAAKSRVATAAEPLTAPVPAVGKGRGRKAAKPAAKAPAENDADAAFEENQPEPDAPVDEDEDDEDEADEPSGPLA